MTTFIAAVALSCCLTACGGAPKPKPLPADPPSPSPTASTPTPPALPAAAKANTKAGAEAFVRHYVELINYAQATGDTSAMRAFESAACHSCNRARRYLNQIYRKGGQIRGGTWLVDQTAGFPGRDAHAWVIDVLGHFTPSVVIANEGAKPKVTKGGQAPTTFFVSYAGSWKVTAWTRGV